MEGAALSAPVDEVVLTEQNPPLSETPEVVPSVRVEADVSAASLQMEGAALSAPVDEVVLTEQNPPLSGTSASTLVAGPMAGPEVESPALSPLTTAPSS